MYYYGETRLAHANGVDKVDKDGLLLCLGTVLWNTLGGSFVERLCFT